MQTEKIERFPTRELQLQKLYSHKLRKGWPHRQTQVLWVYFWKLCLTEDPPLLWASSCDRELTATLHREQYSSFFALSSSVSGWDGLLEAEAPASPESCSPDPGCSEPVVLPHPGEEEVRGTRGGVGVGRRGHTEGTGESMGGVGGVGSEGSGPGANRGSFNCDRGCVSSEKKKHTRKNNRN